MKRSTDPIFNVWLSVAEAAAAAGLTPATVHLWIRRGKIQQVRGRRGSYRIRLDEVLPLREPITKKDVKP